MLVLDSDFDFHCFFDFKKGTHGIFLYTGKQKGAKLALKLMDEEKRKAVAVGIAAWADRHRVKSSDIVNDFGKHVFPTSWLQTAGDMAAREVKDKNIKTVDDSIRVLGKIDSMTNVELLIFSDQLKKAGLNVKNLIFDVSKPKPDMDIQAIVGAHTITSIGKSHQARPNNVTYQTIHCSLLVCEDTPENRQMAKAYGALENKVKDNRNKTDTWDQIWTMHQSYVNLIKTVGLDNQKLFKKAWVIEKARLDVSTRTGSKGSFDQNITIAQRTGPVFDLIAKIFKGEVANLKTTDKPVKPPTGVGHFKMMGGIPDEKLVEWLQRVVQGDDETKDFAQNCLRYKQKFSIREAIVEYIQVVRDRENLTWDLVVQEWPNIGDEAWFALLMGWVGAVTTVVLTNAIKEEILNRLLLDEQDDDDDVQGSQVFLCIRYTICDYVVFLY